MCRILVMLSSHWLQWIIHDVKPQCQTATSALCFEIVKAPVSIFGAIFSRCSRKIPSTANCSHRFQKPHLRCIYAKISVIPVGSLFLTHHPTNDTQEISVLKCESDVVNFGCPIKSQVMSMMILELQRSWIIPLVVKLKVTCLLVYVFHIIHSYYLDTQLVLYITFPVRTKRWEVCKLK